MMNLPSINCPATICYLARTGKSMTETYGVLVMRNVLITLVVLAVTGFLLVLRGVLFRGQPSTHRRVLIMPFGDRDRLDEEEWPSLIVSDSELPSMKEFEHSRL